MTFPKLEKAIRDACPETMALTFGCRVQIKSGEFASRIFVYKGEEMIVGDALSEDGALQSEGDRCGSCDFDKQEYEIIGHELTLAHVLRAIDAVRPLPREWVSVDCSGYFLTMKGDQALGNGLWWDLTKNLADQSDETKQFLENIICP